MYPYDASITVDKQQKNFLSFSKEKGLTTTQPSFFGKFFPVFTAPMKTIGLSADELAIENIITFKEVSKISFDFRNAVALENGLTKSLLQPWYIEPAAIHISGASYLGAWFDISNEDTDVEDFYRMFTDNFAEITGNRNVIVLEVVNNPKNTDRFYGYIQSFNFSEDVSQPYVLKYEIDYIGKPEFDSVKNDAISGISKDKGKEKL